MIPVIPSNLSYSSSYLAFQTHNNFLEKLVFDGNHLRYLRKDGDNSYVDQF